MLRQVVVDCAHLFSCRRCEVAFSDSGARSVLDLFHQTSSNIIKLSSSILLLLHVQILHQAQAAPLAAFLHLGVHQDAPHQAHLDSGQNVTDTGQLHKTLPQLAVTLSGRVFLSQVRP